MFFFSLIYFFGRRFFFIEYCVFFRVVNSEIIYKVTYLLVLFSFELGLVFIFLIVVKIVFNSGFSCLEEIVVGCVYFKKLVVE